MNIHQTLTCLKTISRKELKRLMRMWGQTLFPPLITSALYFIVFGTIVGSRFELKNGMNFITFMTPGLIMMSVIMNSYTNVCSSFFIAKFQKSIEEILVSPCSSNVIILGFVSGGIIRSSIIMFLILFVSSFFTDIKLAHPLLFFIFNLLTAVLFSLAGLLNAIFAKKFDDISIVPTFILTPLSYLGGVFYSIEQLPQSWQAVSKLNPIFYLINGLRYSFIGKSDINFYFSITVLIALLCCLYILIFFLIEKGTGLKT